MWLFNRSNSDSQHAHKKLISQAHEACAFALNWFRWNKAPKSIATVALNFLTILFQFLLPFGIPVRLSSISQFFDNMMWQLPLFFFSNGISCITFHSNLYPQCPNHFSLLTLIPGPHTNWRPRLCSSCAQWPLAPNFCFRALRKS